MLSVALSLWISSKRSPRKQRAWRPPELDCPNLPKIMEKIKANPAKILLESTLPDAKGVQTLSHQTTLFSVTLP